MKNRLLAMSLFSALLLPFHSSWSATDDAVIVYPAVSNGTTAIIEGRVIEKKRNAAPTKSDRKRHNLRRNVELMINNERKHYPITVKLGELKWDTTTDQEGYFRVEVASLAAFRPGWHTITGTTANGEGIAGLIIVPPENTQGIISDIDDTVQVTEVNSKSKMMANTFLHNSTQRQAVPGVVNFYRHLASLSPQPELTPIVYLSASPRQLHGAIDSFLLFNEFPKGVLTTKRVTNDRTSEPITNQVAYKTAKIEAILKQLPLVKFTLIGDDGEHDPEVYADIQKRFPDHVSAIWIRQVNPDPKRVRIEGQGVLNEELRKYITRDP